MGGNDNMSLRKAKIDDHWRRVFKRNYTIEIDNISIIEEHAFSEFRANLSKGISCIVGKNGIGKSNFIRTIYNAFHTSDSNREMFHLSIIKDGLVDINYSINKDIHHSSTKVGERLNQIDDASITSFLYDPCNTVPTLQEMLKTQDNLEEMLVGYNETTLPDKDLTIINYLTGNHYDVVKIITIEDEYDNFPNFPFFSVTINSISYDVRTMGLGEFSLFYFYWIINYVSKYEGNKILLIEEPESFLPPSSQVKLANILVKSIDENGISCILSSHSEHIIKRIPRDNILIFSKLGNKIKCKQALDNFEHLKTIGLSAPKLGILLFEDTAAIQFFKTLIKNSKEYVPDSFYYLNSGSESNIINDLKSIPSKIESFLIIGIFDGDCRNTIIKLPETSYYTYLPSEYNPETLLIKFLKDINPNDLALLFNKTVDEINYALDETTGCDHHDYFEIMSRSLDSEYNFIFSSVCKIWTETPSNKSMVDKFMTEFRSIVN